MKSFYHPYKVQGFCMMWPSIQQNTTQNCSRRWIKSYFISFRITSKEAILLNYYIIAVINATNKSCIIHAAVN